MIIICEECATAYNLDDSLVKDNGSTVRCTKCRHEFVVYPYDGAKAAGEYPETAGAPPSGEDDSLGLLDSDPLPFDPATEDGPLVDERETAISGDGIEIEMDPEYAESELTLETEDGLEDLAENDLPAIEDLEGFDEALLTGSDEPPAGEMFDQDTEPLLEEEASGSVDEPADNLEEDILDLSDIEDLVNCGEFPGAGEPCSPEAEEEPLLLEPDEDDGLEPTDIAGNGETSEVLDLSEIERMPAEDEEPLLMLDDSCHTIAGDEDPGQAEDIFLEPDGPENEPEIEIHFEPDDGFSESKAPHEEAPAADTGPEILFEEQPPDEDDVPEILFEEPAPVDFEGETPWRDDDDRIAGPSDSDVTAVLDGEATQLIESPPVVPSVEIPANSGKSRKSLLAVAAAPVMIAAITLAVSLSGLKVSDLAGMLKTMPFAGEFLGFGKNDPAGNVRILPLEESVSCKFVDNASSGRLFVIEGRVRNAYDHPRSHIKIVGRLYQDGKRLLKTNRVYCGNMLSDAELEAMDMGMISQRLDNHRGENQSNLTIEPGGSIPFMIVFSQLPDNLDEYSIQVDSSSG